MKIIAVRHGETEGNAGHIVESRTHGRLTYAGVEQVRMTAWQLKDEPVDVIYASNLQRCMNTAFYIAEYHPSAHFIPVHDLRERNQGIYEGTSWEDVPFWDYEGEHIGRQIPGGESWRDVERRVARFLNEIYTVHPDSSVILVTHGGTLKALRSLLVPMSLRESIDVRVNNASAHYFTMTAPVRCGL